MQNDDNEQVDQNIAPGAAFDNLEQPVGTKENKTKDIPHVGDNIVYKMKENDTWVKAKVVSKGGKSTGKNWAYLNLQDENEDAQVGIDFAKDVQEWRTAQDVDEVNAVVVPQSRHNENQVKHAKQLEMDNWKSFNVYDEILYSGQKLMSTRWVITEKEMNGERKVKARLVVRGFEEENEVKSDSPTVHKESVRLFLAIASTSEFNIHSIDIKAAFLQGLNIQHEGNDIYLQQHDYTDELKQVDRADIKNGIYPEIVGQLHWIATQSRPDLFFDVLDLSTSIQLSEAKTQSKLNKIIRKAKNNSYRIKYPNLESLKNIELILYTDASYANLSDHVSSAGGYVIFLLGQNGKNCPISWSSKKIRRVVKSTLAAEALSLVEGLDACYFVRSILQEMIKLNAGESIPIKCFTDNKSLCQNIYSTKLISEKWLCLDLASIKESVSLGDITVTWIKTSSQISDCLTKAGADFHPLIKVLCTGKGP
ncbi:unnamed protein product [Mytilus coruscus]|uniref:Reverse transcriptase Ty1/copia-type domain-containing protein n=1 Tax=Mytilus coruscus TaxID=42192 RepID=A0A6J8DPY3_MYTCO|nr:unnamed protein product [Mytilus coruscus]